MRVDQVRPPSVDRPIPQLPVPIPDSRGRWSTARSPRPFAGRRSPPPTHASPALTAKGSISIETRLRITLLAEGRAAPQRQHECEENEAVSSRSSVRRAIPNGRDALRCRVVEAPEPQLAVAGRRIAPRREQGGLGEVEIAGAVVAGKLGPLDGDGPRAAVSRTGFPQVVPPSRETTASTSKEPFGLRDRHRTPSAPVGE